MSKCKNNVELTHHKLDYAKSKILLNTVRIDYYYYYYYY
jgi:hypothetical protein